MWSVIKLISQIFCSILLQSSWSTEHDVCMLMPLMPFYSWKSLVWNPFLELLVGVLHVFHVYSPYLTWTHSFTKRFIYVNWHSSTGPCFLKGTSKLKTGSGTANCPAASCRCKEWPGGADIDEAAEVQSIKTRVVKLLGDENHRKDGSQCQDGGGMYMICFMEYINCMF